jgi:hypothetical protein
LSPSRTPSFANPSRSSRSVRLRLAVSGPALALLAVTGGLLGSAGAAPTATAGPGHLASVSSRPTAARPIILDALSAPQSRSAVSASASRPRHRPTPRQIAWTMLRRFRWSSARQFPYLSKLWKRESGWNVHALNPYSGAAGIPQAVPGSKMASAGPDWWSNAWTQIRWGLRYIRARYGSPRNAWYHEISVGWY